MASSRRDQIGLAAALALATVAVLVTIGAAVPQRVVASDVAIGVYLPGDDRDPGVVDAYTSAVGHEPAIISVYCDWSEQPFERVVLDPILARGAAPMVTWEPWRHWSEGVSLSSIANGAEDGYIAEAARQAAAWGAPIFVRFAHEMNGSWYPWGRHVNGNTPQIYKAAWRHVVRVFRANGAGNVRWVWTPYVAGGGHFPFKRFYPGDKWVNWAGLDGFNWGTRFVSFRKLFGDSYREMITLTPKALMIGETGSVEYGGDKATWITHALDDALPRFTHIRALVWWSGVHPEKGTDVRLDSSQASFDAWILALQAQRLNPGYDFLLARPSWLRRHR